MRLYAGVFFPESQPLTRAFRARLDMERVYRGDRLREALPLVPRKRLALDCGANVGIWTMELASCFSRVVAVEASAENVAALKANVASMPQVRVVHAALGAQAGKVGLEERKGPFSSRVTEGDAVPMIRVDDLELEFVDYAKVHVNGYEMQVLQGAVDTLKRCRPVLTVVLKPALSKQGFTPEQVVDFLAAQGYRLAGGQKPYRIFTAE